MTAQTLRGDVAVLVPAAGAGVRLGPGGPKALRELRRGAAAGARGAPVCGRRPSGRSSSPRRRTSVDAVCAPAGRRSHRGVRGRGRGEPAGCPSRRRWPRPIPGSASCWSTTPPARSPHPTLIERVAAAVRAGSPAVIPVLPVVDTIKQVDDAGPGARHGRPRRAAGRADPAGLPPRRPGRPRTRPRSTSTPTTPGWPRRWACRCTPCPATRPP